LSGRPPLRGAPDLTELERNAAEVAGLLRLLANEKRLLILCQLVTSGEMSVGNLAEAINLSSSALSQHLAKMRDEGLVATRRKSQTVRYRLAEGNAAHVLKLLKSLSFPGAPENTSRNTRYADP